MEQNNHPKSLPFLFLTEMWERFGFYVVQGLLILYITQYFGYSDSEGYTILGFFSALAYVSPFIGGFLADKILGFKNAIIWGGLFLIIGYALLTLPYPNFLFYPALATIIVGNGMFKPNISSLLGTQYASNNPKRESGFTIFYVGINLGALLAGLSSGYIKNYFGWRTSFGLASLGLIIGLFTFIFGLRYIKNIESKKVKSSFNFQFFIYCLIAILGINFLLRIHVLANWLLPIAGVLLLIFLFLTTFLQKGDARKSLIVLSILIISSIVFWTLFFQLFFAANLFVDRLVDKNFLGIPLSTTVFYASESIFIIALGPIFSWFWHYLARQNKNPSPILKFMIGMLMTGLGFWLLSWSTVFPNQQGLIPPIWVFGSYFLITIGELLLSPIGLSAVSLLAPTNLIGMLMGVWFVGTGLGGYFAGLIAKLASIPDTITDTTTKLMIYQNAFLNFAYLAFVMAVILFFTYALIRKAHSR